MNLEKSLVEGDWGNDHGVLSAEYKDSWASLAYKAYEGGAEIIRVINPKKKPVNVDLTRSEEQRNAKVSSDRIIVENVLGGYLVYGM